jgi:hypothetical protein
MVARKTGSATNWWRDESIGFAPTGLDDSTLLNKLVLIRVISVNPRLI